MTHEQRNHLPSLCEQVLTDARDASSGRAARTLVGERGQPMRQTLIALLADHQLADHPNPGQATLQVLIGAVALHTGDTTTRATAGTLLLVPEKEHALTAETDSVVLLTVAVAAAPP